MASVDDRIVKMEFDNAQFEKGVAETTTSLGNLKKALKIDDAAKSLDSLSKTVGKIDVSGLNNATDTIKERFSGLGTIATGALLRIGSTAADVGAQVLKSLTVQPMIDGFNEYETQMKSIQTIMANTADAFNDPMGDSQKHLDAVNEKLNELNTYADKTIYNFSEMTRNIGTFTAAGVDLDTATSSIQGIANLAAVSGSTSTQASTAMYQLSQAIATGTVKLQDWNSVVNASMGGKTFQNALIRTARHLGTGVDEAIKKSGSFRESLTKSGWLTTEVLTETLKQLTLNVSTQEEYNNTVADLVKQGYTQKEAEQIASLAKNSQDAATKVRTFIQLVDTVKEALGSGWTQSWQIIFGDFNTATNLWTSVNDEVSDFVQKTSDARNAALKMWADAGGRQAMLDILSNTLSAIESQIGPIAEGFASIIPQDLPVQIANLMRQFADWLKWFTFLPHAREELYQIGALIGNIVKTVSGAAFNVITGAVYGLHSILDGLLHIILGVAGGIATLLNTGLQPLLLIIQHLSVWINTLLAKLGDFIGQQIFRRIGDTIELIIHRIEEFFEKLFEGSTFIQDFANALDIADSGFAKFLDTLIEIAGNGLGVLTDALHTVINALFDFLDAGATAFNGFAKNAFAAIGNLFNFLKEFGSILKNTFGKVFVTIGTQIARIWSAIVDSFKGTASVFKPLIDIFNSFGSKTQDAFGKILDGTRTASDAFIKFVDNVAPKVADFIIQNIIPAIQKFGSVAMTVFGAFATFIAGTVAPAIQKFASTAVDRFGKIADFVSTNLWPVIKEFGSNAQQAFGKLGDFVVSKTVPAFEKFSNKAKNVFDKFGDAISDFQNTTKTGFSNASDYISAFGDSVGKSFGIAQDKIRPFTNALGVAAEFIGGVLSKIVGFFKDAFGGVAQAVSQFNVDDIPNSLMKLATAIGNAFTEHVIPAIQNGAELAFNFVQTAFSSIGDQLVPLFTDTILPAIADGLTQTGQGAIQLLQSFIDGFFGDGFGLIKTAYADTIDNATTDASQQTTAAIPNAFSGINSAVQHMADGVAEALRGSAAGLADRIKAVIGGIKDAFLNVFGHDWEEVKERIDYVTDVILKVSLSKFIKGIGDALTNISAIGKKLASAVDTAAKALNNAMKAIKRLAGAAEIAAFGYTIMKIAEAIQMMSDIVKNNDLDTLKASIGIIAGVLGALVVVMLIIDKVTASNPAAKAAKLGDGISGIMDALNQVGEGVKLAAIGFSIAMLGLAVKMIAEAFKTLQGMSLTDMAPGLIAFGLALLGFAVAVRVLNSESKNMLMASAAILGLAISLQIIANVINQVHDMITTDAKGFGLAALAVAGGLAALAGVLIAVSKLAGDNGGGAAKASIAVFVLTLALKQFADVVQVYTQIPWTQLWQSTLMAVVGLAALTAALIALSRFGGSGDQLGKAALALVTVSGSLRLFAESIQVLASLDMVKAAQSCFILVAGLTAMTVALLALTNLANGGELLMAAGSLLMVSGALGVLALSIGYLSQMDMAGVAGATIALSAALAVMTVALLALTNLANGGELLMAAGSLLMVSGALGVLSLAIGNLAQMDMAHVAVATIALSAALAVMTGALIALSGVGPMALVAAGAILMVAAALWIVADAIEKLANCLDKFKDVGDAPTNIQATLTAIGEGLAAGKNGIDKFLSGAAYEKACDVLMQLANTMEVWKDPATVLAGMNIYNCLSAIGRGLSAGDASGIGKYFASLADANVMNGLTQLAGSIKNYINIGNAPDNLEKVLQKLNANLGGFTFNNSKSLEETATGLGHLGTSIGNYAGLDDSVFTNIEKVLTTLNQNMPGFISFGDSATTLGSLADGLNVLAGSFEAYSGGDVTNAITNIDRVLHTIYTDMDDLGDLLVGGAADGMSKVADGLGKIAGQIGNYADGNAGTASTNIKKILDAVFNGLNPLVGIFGNGAGDVFETTANGLARLGYVLEKYANMGDANTNIETILTTTSTGVEKFQNCRAGADAMSVAAGSLSTLAGALPQFSGIDMGAIATQLGQLDQAIQGFTTSGANISTAATNLESLAGACQKLGGTLQGTADGVGNLAGKFWDLSNNASGAISVIPGLSGACDGLAGTLQGCADGIGNLAGKFWDLSNNAGPAIQTVSNLAGACNGLEGPLQGTAAAVGNLAGKFWDLQNNASNAVSSVSTSFQGMCDAIGSSIQTAANNVTNSMQTIVDVIQQKGSEAVQQATLKGNQVGQKFAEGIRGHSFLVAGAANLLANTAINSLNGHAGAAYSAGANISNSFASGLSSAVGKARAAADALASQAQRAIEARAKIGSPSKVAIWEGKMVGDGFAIGIKDRVSNVEDAANRYADAAFNAMNRATGMIDDVIANKNYVMPITPVVDGSAIQNGINWSNYGLSTLGTYQLAVDGNAMAAQNRRQNQDLIEALRSDMKRYTNAVLDKDTYTYQMGNAVINDDDQIRGTLIDLISQLNRRAAMNRGRA